MKCIIQYSQEKNVPHSINLGLNSIKHLTHWLNQHSSQSLCDPRYPDMKWPLAPQWGFFFFHFPAWVTLAIIGFWAPPALWFFGSTTSCNSSTVILWIAMKCCTDICCSVEMFPGASCFGCSNVCCIMHNKVPRGASPQQMGRIHTVTSTVEDTVNGG